MLARRISQWIAAASLAGCQVVQGSTPTVRVEHEVREFDRVVSDSLMDVEIRIGPGHSVTTVAQPALQDRVVVTVVGNTLQLRNASGRGGLVRIRDTSRIEVTMPRLTELIVDREDLSVVGLDGGSLDVSMKSHGDLTLAGQLDSLNLRARADVHASGLIVSNASVRLRRNAVRLGEVKSTITSTGEGRLTYAGSPANVDLGHDSP